MLIFSASSKIKISSNSQKINFFVQILMDKSSCRRCSVRKGVLRNFAKFAGKHLCQSLFFNKVADLRPATLLKKRLWHRCFSVKFVKFLRTPFLQNTPWRLHLYEIVIILSSLTDMQFNT